MALYYGVAIIPARRIKPRDKEAVEFNVVGWLETRLDILIKNIVQADSFVKVLIKTKPHSQICPDCGLNTKRIHDYRSQIINDLPFQLKHTYLVLGK